LFTDERTRQIFKSEIYAVTDVWVRKIIDWSDLSPTVDAFAFAKDARLPTFWDRDRDAFDQSWHGQTLWMNPPFTKLSLVLDKIVSEEAHGILIIPVWPRFAWFDLLARIAPKWMDIPPDEQFYVDERGEPLPRRYN